MNEEQRTKFFQKKQEFEKEEKHKVDNMVKNFDKLTEKEKQEFLSNMTVQEKKKFFQKREEHERK